MQIYKLPKHQGQVIFLKWTCLDHVTLWRMAFPKPVASNHLARCSLEQSLHVYDYLCYWKWNLEGNFGPTDGGANTAQKMEGWKGDVICQPHRQSGRLSAHISQWKKARKREKIERPSLTFHEFGIKVGRSCFLASPSKINPSPFCSSYTMFPSFTAFDKSLCTITYHFGRFHPLASSAASSLM